MLEGVLQLGVLRVLVEKLSILEGWKRFAQGRTAHFDDAFELAFAEGLADDRGRLQDVLLAFQEAIDPCCQHARRQR